MLGGQEVGRQPADLGDGKPSRPQGSHPLDHVRLAEAGIVGAQAAVGVGQRRHHLVETQRRPPGVVRLSTAPSSTPACEADGGRLGRPAVPEPFRGQLPVLGRPGRQRRLMVGPHALHRRVVHPARALQVGVDLRGALRERPQLARSETDHLPATIHVGTPRHAQLRGQDAAQLLLVHAARRLRPGEQDGTIQASHTSRRHDAPRSGRCNECATADHRHATCDARTSPPPTHPSPPGYGPRRSAGATPPPCPPRTPAPRRPPEHGPATRPTPPPATRTPTATTPTSAPRTWRQTRSPSEPAVPPATTSHPADRRR